MLILLVCSGNTCRSPLAAAMLTAKLRAHPSLAGIQVMSAGTGAETGMPASQGSRTVAKELGLDLETHRSQQVTRDLLAQADLVLTMGENHAERIRQFDPNSPATTLTRYLGDRPPRDIADPWGGTDDDYRSVASLLDPLLERLVRTLHPGTDT